MEQYRTENEQPFFLFGNVLFDQSGADILGVPFEQGEFSLLAHTSNGGMELRIQFSFSCDRRRLAVRDYSDFSRATLTKQLRKSEFVGASGHVTFEGMVLNERNPNWVDMGAYIVLPSEPEPNSTLRYNYTSSLISIFDADVGEWEDVLQNAARSRFYQTLDRGREANESNYLPRALRWIGFVLMAIVYLLSFSTMFLLAVARKKSFVRDAQPLYLHLLCVGSIVMCTSIFTLSWDEQGMPNDTVLTTFCTATPWLFFLGHVTISTSLMTMLIRLNAARNYGGQCSYVEKKLYYLISALVMTCTLLIVWTFVDPWEWGRIDITEIPLETYGRCHCEYFAIFFGILAGMLLLLGAACFCVAWKSGHNAVAGSILYASYAQVQCWVFGLPMLAALGTTSVEGTYFGRVLIIWVLSVTSIVVVVGPTSLRILRSRLDAEGGDPSRPRMIMVSLMDPSSELDDGTMSMHIRS